MCELGGLGPADSSVSQTEHGVEKVRSKLQISLNGLGASFFT